VRKKLEQELKSNQNEKKKFRNLYYSASSKIYDEEK
jgi:hypothetical protein